MEIDFKRTQNAYNLQMEAFMKCFIMNCSPFELDESVLLDEARARSNVPYHCWSWIENTSRFCSICRLEEIINVAKTEYFPAYNINRFSGQIGDVANGYFLRTWYPIVDDPSYRIIQSHPTKSTFIDPIREDNDLEVLSKHVDQELIYCYSFPARDDYGKERSCFRFSTVDNLRFAILKTVCFTLNFILTYPLSCFHGPYIKDVPGFYGFKNDEMREVLLPVFSVYEGRLQKRREWVERQLGHYHLHAEVF